MATWFRAICDMRRVRVGGAFLGTAIASLAALLGPVGVAAAAAALGIGTCVVTREWGEYLKGRSDMKDLPFYLLWRLGGENAA